jgi:hypothetical protein
VLWELKSTGKSSDSHQQKASQQLTPILPAQDEHSQELRTLQEGLIPLDDRFGDSGIGKSMSSQVQSSLVSEDGGFINQIPIPGRHLQEEVQDKMQDDIQIEAMFKKQQRERQWLASQVTKQHQEEGQEIAEFEEQLRK